MAKNKIIYNGNTLIDLTGDTVTADKLMQGYTAHDRSGALITGTGTGGSGQGNVWQDAQGYVNLDDESGISMQTKSVSPTESAQTVTPDNGYTGLEQVNVGAISSSYVGSGVTRQGATTYTPTTTDQTIASGKYLTGTQTIKGDANLVASNIAKDVEIFGVTGTHEGGGEPNLLARNVEVSPNAQIVTAQSKITDVAKNYSASSQQTGSTNKGLGIENFNFGDLVRIVGAISIIDSNGSILEEISVAVDNYLLNRNSVSSSIIVENSTYIVNYGFFISSNTNAVTISLNRKVAGTYGFNINLDFYGASSYDGLSSVTVGSGYDETLIKNYISRSSLFTDFTFPSGITNIGAYAFMNCSQLALTSLPSTVIDIDTYAFNGCASLALTSLPSGLTRIKGYSFQSCYNLALTSLPSGVTQIDSGAFSGCTALALTSLPNALTKIDSYAFRYCYNISISTLPTTLTYIGSNAFERCVGITSISCTGSITNLGATAFNGNSSYPMQLTSANFPNMALTSNLGTVFGYTTAANACQLLEFCDIGSTTGIAANAFANCYALETLVLRKTSAVCTLANVSAFTNTPMSGYNSKTGTVYVPSDLISSYQTATNWKTLYDGGTVTFEAIEGSDYEL